MMTHDMPLRTRQQEVLHGLLRDHGLRRYGLFFVTGEGMELPGQLEAASGYAIDEAGRVYSFWLGWDERMQAPVFTEWGQLDVDPRWESSDEFRRARAAAAA